MDARLKNLDYAFNPGSIAFVGASESLNKWGFLILNNILTGGYEGRVYPVNPGRESVLGLRAYPRSATSPEIFISPYSAFPPSRFSELSRTVSPGVLKQALS